MKQIYEDRNKFNISEDMSLVDKIKQLNKYTLDFIIPHFSKIVQHSIQNKKKKTRSNSCQKLVIMQKETLSIYPNEFSNDVDVLMLMSTIK